MCCNELERLLLEPNGLERARELAQARAAKGESPDAAPSGGIVAGDPPPHLAIPSREEVLAQDLSVVSLPRVHGLDAFIAELTDKSASEALGVLEARFHKDPGPANAALLQAGINRITRVASSRQSDREAAKRAIEVFQAGAEK